MKILNLSHSIYRPIFLTCIIISIAFGMLHGQTYQTAAGLRLGTDIGLTVQQRIGKYQTLEGLLQTSLFREAGQVSVLWERHYPLVSRGFNFYMGAGPHLGWYESQDDLNLQTSAGLSVIGGAELTLGKISISYDIKPAINLVNPRRLIEVQSAVSVRAVIVKRSKSKQKSGLFQKKDNRSTNQKKKRKGWFNKKSKATKI